MIVALTGPRKNIGDYLIADRGIALLRKYVDPDVVEINRFSNLRDRLQTVNDARAIFLCGGPAYGESVYPGTYRLVPDLDELVPPIVPFGLGWRGRPIDQPEKFNFDEQSLEFLCDAHTRIENSSARDPITAQILKRQGLSNVLMTGCPVWYDLRYIEREFSARDQVRKIVFTTPDNPRMLKQVFDGIRMLRRMFPDAEITSAFHRGILPDELTSTRASLGYRAMVAAGKAFGVQSVDVSYDLSRIAFYEECDLHVGYRVHAHLHFLSRKQPSILLCEDGRGVGMLQGLKSDPIKAWRPGVVDALRKQLVSELDSNWESSRLACKAIEETYPVMQEYLRQPSLHASQG